MSTSAIIMMTLGILVIPGGLCVCLYIALRKK